MEEELEKEELERTEVPKEAKAFIERNALSMRAEGTADKWREYLSVEDAERACEVALDNQWIRVSERPLEEGVEVIGYNKFWIHPDFNPNGHRIGFLNGDGHFTSAKWNNDQDCYDTLWEEGDDYFASQTQEDSRVKTWCDGPSGESTGYVPNMPTHYMLIPKHP